ncbi:MAG TPA: 1,2-phenylacetyl-CoA epoxidase subunit PaaD [Actinomycetota bacterium]|nr:1,2-phenylacetyl-CoA epoxidase subunit PaaD [Actinomycetota bacterium]
MVTERGTLEKSTQNVSQDESIPDGRAAAGGVEDRVWGAVAAVHDPEIPPCSIVDLGIVQRVEISESSIEVDLLPTFAGCPALDAIQVDVRAAVEAVSDGKEVRVRFVYSPPWTSDRMTERGREALKGYGVTPPDEARSVTGGQAFLPLTALQVDAPPLSCPFCGSRQTVVESRFGPTLCRTIHFCEACRNPFEGFKPKTIAT